MQWLEAFWTKEGKGIAKDAPKKTGLALFLEILGREWWELVKLNLLFILASLPVVTMPAALFATASVCRSVAADRNVYLLRDFVDAMRIHIWLSLLWSVVSGGLLAVGIYAIVIYASEARESLLYAFPLTLSLVGTVFVLISALYFVMISVSADRLGRLLSAGACLRLAALATLLRPLPVLMSLVFVAALWIAHIAFYPVSVFMPATMNFSLGMFAIAFAAGPTVAQLLAAPEEDGGDR